MSDEFLKGSDINLKTDWNEIEPHNGWSLFIWDISPQSECIM